MAHKVAIIGCGRMATTIDDEVANLVGTSGLVLPYCHAGGYAAVAETEMVAACDVDEERLRNAQRRWNIPRGYTDYRECIDREKPEIISVTTRPEQHAEIMLYAAEHGVKGMYVEKPLVCSLEETDRVAEALRRNDVQLEFGPMRRNWAVFQRARALAESGELGEARAAIALNGGTPCGGHVLDTLLYLLGDPEPVSVRATLGKLSPADGDTTNMRFKPDAPMEFARALFTNGTQLAVLRAGLPGEYELALTEGTIRISNDGHHLRARRLDKPTRQFLEHAVSEVEHWSGTERKVRDLVEAVRTGRPQVSSLAATLISQELGYAMYESHLRGGVEVAVPLTENRERWVSSW